MKEISFSFGLSNYISQKTFLSASVSQNGNNPIQQTFFPIIDCNSILDKASLESKFNAELPWLEYNQFFSSGIIYSEMGITQNNLDQVWETTDLPKVC